MYQHALSLVKALTNVSSVVVSRARLTLPLVQRQAVALSSNPKQALRTFFSLPSFPPSTTSQTEVHSVEDLSVKDRYSKKGDLLVYKETKRLPYTKEQLYNVIADVEAYPEFVPFCTGSNLYSVKTLGNSTSGEHTKDDRTKPWLQKGYSAETHLLESELVVGFKSFQESYTSQVECRKWDMVKATSSNSKLFKHLTSTWTFKSPAEISFPHSILATKDASETVSTYISLELAFAFSSPLHATISELFWKAVSERMVSSFEARVNRVHGLPSLKPLRKIPPGHLPSCSS